MWDAKGRFIDRTQGARWLGDLLVRGGDVQRKARGYWTNYETNGRLFPAYVTGTSDA